MPANQTVYKQKHEPVPPNRQTLYLKLDGPPDVALDELRPLLRRSDAVECWMSSNDHTDYKLSVE